MTTVQPEYSCNYGTENGSAECECLLQCDYETDKSEAECSLVKRKPISMRAQDNPSGVPMYFESSAIIASNPFSLKSSREFTPVQEQKEVKEKTKKEKHSHTKEKSKDKEAKLPIVEKTDLDENPSKNE